jgi:hypothetical protein
MKSRTQRRRAWLRQLTAGGVLLLHLAAFSPLGVAFATAFGSLDRDHRLNLLAGDGGLQVVLRHQPGCLTHHHGSVARALTVFARPAGPGEPDHVLQFRSADYLVSAAEVESSQAAADDPASTAPLTLAGPGSPLVPMVAAPTHLPHTESGGLLGLRSTVLLI